MLQRGLFERARLRLAGWYVAFLGVILLVLDVGVFLVMGSALESRLDEDLQHKAGQASSAISYVGGASRFDRSDIASDPSWSEVSLYAATASGSLLATSAPFAKAVLPDQRALSGGLSGRSGYTTVLRSGEPFIVYTQPVYAQAVAGSRVSAVVQVARSARSLAEASTSLVSLLLGATLVSLVLAFVAGLWLADKALEPIRLGLLRQKEFVSDASHELRTPVTVIRAAAENIMRQRQKGSPRVAALAQDIVSETVQLGRMVEDLGVLAQADARSGLRREPLAVARLLEEVCASARLLGEARRVEVRCDIDAKGDLRGDEVRLRQLFSILVDNATRVSPPGKPVGIKASSGGDRLRVCIVDSGPGIPEAELPRIFQRFYRGADQRQHEGSGLGLAIAQWIVQEHGGTISVRSQVGAGTEFAVELRLE
jgi:two-component system sensor histidine kinase CiaH